ncbi:hypothetical protein KI372_10260 [Halobacterium salinarum]|nr:hypothetical protein [Halobacterium salinarum]MCF2241725.1 hypothetical protein [Halobacterium salinarum]
MLSPQGVCMAERTEPGLSDQYTRASPWPIPLVIGIVVTEVGLVFEGLTPVAVSGMLLFAACVVGITRESAFADTLWRPGVAVGVLFAVLGAVIYTGTTATTRGIAMLGTSVLVWTASAVAFLYETQRL